MTEQTDPPENQYLSPPRFQQLPLMKLNSFMFDYDEIDDLKEIQEQQNVLERDYDYFHSLLWNYDISKIQIDVQILGDISQKQPDSPLTLNNAVQIEIKPPQEPVQKKKFIDKSYCRYIMLYVFRTIENPQYADIIRDICSKFQVSYNIFVEYYRKQRILIMGYQTLKKELIYDNDSIPDQNRKKAFKEVLVWYLDKLATKHILLSKKQNYKEYLRFKNYVMSYYMHNPKSWAGNKPLWS